MTEQDWQAQWQQLWDASETLDELREKTVAALAAAYQQGREAGFLLGFDNGVNAVDKFGDVDETAEEAFARCYPAGTAPEALDGK